MLALEARTPVGALALDVAIDVGPGRCLALAGPSGAGKTSVLRIAAGLVRPERGRVEANGQTWLDTERNVDVPPERRRCGYVFQEYALFPHLSAWRNVAYGLHELPRRERERAARALLARFGLADRADARPATLSGGERQRVALARALAPEPQVVLLDEPFSSLDATLRADLRREVELILRDAEATALLVTHDQEEALSLADRLAVMREGRIVQVGAPEEVYGRPASRWAAQFVGEVNVLAGVAREGEVETELGRFDLRAPATGTVHVAVRPEQLELSGDHDPNAEVLEREFRGHDVLYRLRHETGRTVLVQLPSLELYEVGARVFVRPAATAVTSLVD